ncbi:hypothetical protein GF359_01225 [candidate division WOR-3 bacterium]|uniref:T9SS type A sorting domain-containing protein n=1 Tax=candidate division WOR-3 bacterium TaxID=2052148 RepID=A0A9D5K9L3_UNCW3|nr:hypothetical protein [candidate division WOR-3 bacterium]MBD3363816.1 hypothetical protein [candidate division WOR-3 bacterium]
MKKILVMVVVCLSFVLMPGFTLTSIDANDFRGTSRLQADGLDTLELAEDEADKFNIYLCTWYLVVNAGDRLAVKFTPPNYPFRILEAAYVPVGSIDDSTYRETCTLIFYDEGMQGPGAQMGQRTASAEYPLWFNWFDVSDMNMVVESGSFYFAVQYHKANLPVFQYDLVKPLHHASWYYTQDQGWRSWDNVTLEDHPKPMGDTADLILRIKGSLPSGDILELEPDIMQPTTLKVSGDEIYYTVEQSDYIEITLWDAIGRKRADIHKGFMNPGEYSNNLNYSGLPRGIYYILMDAGDIHTGTKFTVLE